jgi:hypothetical protein
MPAHRNLSPKNAGVNGLTVTFNGMRIGKTAEGFSEVFACGPPLSLTPIQFQSSFVLVFLKQSGWFLRAAAG